MDINTHRLEMIKWLIDFVDSERYRKLKYLNIYYPDLGEPFLKEQRYCILVDDFKDSPVGIIDHSGYHYAKKNHVHGETTCQVDNLIHATHIYQMFKCLKETVSIRLDKFNLNEEGFRERIIVDSYCDIIIHEYDSEIKTFRTRTLNL